MRTIVIAAALIGLAGCGLVSPTPSAPIATAAPDFVRHLQPSEGIVRRLLVYDPPGLLLNVVVPTHSRGGIYDAWWEPVVGDHNSLMFAWLGGHCAVDPTLRVTTHGETNLGIELSLDVFDGHRPPLPSGEVCADAGTNYEVMLTFRRPISDFHVSVSETEEPE
jgi:hypothetical protein